MTTFQISAPDRVILCGEHTVMYGKQVVAASLGLRTTLKFRQLPLESGIVTIRFPNVSIYRLNIPLQMITNFVSSRNVQLVMDNYPSLFKLVQYFITSNCLWKTLEQKFSLEMFFFLLWVIILNEGLVIQPFHVHLTTELKMKAGLGSSTSFATCLAACFLHWSCLQKGDHNGFTPEELERISAYVMCSEDAIQNYVFNQDHLVCTYGRVTAYRCREPLDCESEIINMPEMSICLVDASIRLDKRQRMKQLADKKRKDVIATNDFLDKINNISEKVVKILRIIRNWGTNTESQLLETLYENLQTNLSLNQNFLRKLDLSHSNFDTICLIAKTCGFMGKLTGDGASNVIILLPPSTESERAVNLVRKMMCEGFLASLVTISCTGVGLVQAHQSRT